ncbi:MAG: hypothetical protein AAGF84_14000 [Planctomycetota bacterium]
MSHPRMRPLACLLAVLSCLTLAGCYEDEAEVTVNADGSGTFTQTIRISEQMVVAMTAEDNGSGFSGEAPFDVTREELEAKLGAAGTITAFDLEDLDDGGKRVTVRGSFDDVNAFFQSDYADDSLKLGLEAAADGQAQLTWVAQDDQNTNGPSLDQMYGMAKGLKIVRRVSLPSAPVADQGEVVGNRVEWAMDLTNRDTLAATKAMVAQADDGVLTAQFDPGEIVIEAVAQMGPVGMAQPDAVADAAPVDASGMEVKINTVGWTRYAVLSEDAYPQDNVLSLELELTWPEDSRPLAVYGGELQSLTDDRGTDLVIPADDNFNSRRSDIWEHADSESFRIEAVGPDRAAQALVNLVGHVRVVTRVNVETISLDNPSVLAGKDSVRNDTLDALGFKIKEIDEASVGVTFNEGVEATDVIQSLSATLPDGTPVESNGWGGWANNMNYNFPEDISAMTNLTIEILTGETVVVVPFAVDRVELP